MLDMTHNGPILQSRACEFVACPHCGVPFVSFVFVESGDLSSQAHIEAARTVVNLSSLLPTYAVTRFAGTEEVARARRVWPEVDEETLTATQWTSAVASHRKQHPCGQ